jgi:hypothetical protein
VPLHRLLVSSPDPVPLFLLDEQVTKPGDRAGLAPSRGYETNARPFEVRDEGRSVGRTLNCGGRGSWS